MILSLAAGFFMGFMLSIPPMGPTNFAILAKAFKRDLKAAVAIGTGAAITDFVYIIISYGGVAAIISLIPESVLFWFSDNEKILQIILTLIGCAVVIYYGFKIMKMKITGEEKPPEADIIIQKAKEKAAVSAEKLHQTEHHLEKIINHKIVNERSNLAANVFTGIFLCLSSITLPASWFAIVTYLQGYGVISSNFFSGLLFGAGVFAGAVAWFYAISKYITVNTHRIKQSTMTFINKLFGIVLILLGVFLLYKAFDFAIS